MKFMCAAVIGLLSFYSWSQSHVAIVKSIRGEVEASYGSETKTLKENDLVAVGSALNTREDGFVVLVFQDNTRISLAPSSEIKISDFTEKNPGLINLIKGRLSALVSGDKKGNEKLFIKTPTSISSVREGEFLAAFYNSHSSNIVFDGEVNLNSFSETENESNLALGELAKEGVLLKPGEFSVVSNSNTRPSEPALLNVLQKEQLQKNKDFVIDASPFSPGVSNKIIVPEGLSGKAVSNNFEVLNSELSNVGVKSKSASGVALNINPLNGSFLQIETGRIISPGVTAILDVNSLTYLPGPDVGLVAVDGSYLHPITQSVPSDVNDKKLNYKRHKLQSFSNELDTRFQVNGGISNVFDPQRAQTEFRGTNIELRDN